MCSNLRDQQLKIIIHTHTHTHTHTQTAIYKPHGNNKPKVYNWYTHTKERNPNITLKIVIKSQGREQKKEKRTTKITQKTINKMPINTYLTVITLNVNGLSAPIKRHRVAKWIQKQDSYICCLQKTQFRSEVTHTDWKWGDGKRYSM